MGQVFGIDKPEWKGASGLKMIEHLRALISEKSIEINNVSQSRYKSLGIRQKYLNVVMKLSKSYLKHLVHLSQLALLPLTQWVLPDEAKEYS